MLQIFLASGKSRKPALNGFVRAALVFGTSFLVVGCASMAPQEPLGTGFAPDTPVRFSVVIRDEAPVSVALDKYGHAVVYSQEQLGTAPAVVATLSAHDRKGVTVSLSADVSAIEMEELTSEAVRLVAPTKHTVTYQMFFRLKPLEQAFVKAPQNSPSVSKNLIVISRLH